MFQLTENHQDEKGQKVDFLLGGRRRVKHLAPPTTGHTGDVMGRRRLGGSMWAEEEQLPEQNRSLRYTLFTSAAPNKQLLLLLKP